MTNERRRLGIGIPGDQPAKITTTMLDSDDPGYEDNWWRKHREDMVKANGAFVARLQQYAA